MLIKVLCNAKFAEPQALHPWPRERFVSLLIENADRIELVCGAHAINNKYSRANPAAESLFRWGESERAFFTATGCMVRRDSCSPARPPDGRMALFAAGMNHAAETTACERERPTRTRGLTNTTLPLNRGESGLGFRAVLIVRVGENWELMSCHFYFLFHCSVLANVKFYELIFDGLFLGWGNLDDLLFLRSLASTWKHDMCTNHVKWSQVPST